MTNALRVQPLGTVALYALEQLIYDFVGLLPVIFIYLLACLLTHRWDPHKVIYEFLQSSLTKMAPKAMAAKWSPAVFLIIVSIPVAVLAGGGNPPVVRDTLLVFAACLLMMGLGTWVMILRQQSQRTSNRNQAASQAKESGQ